MISQIVENLHISLSFIGTVQHLYIYVTIIEHREVAMYTTQLKKFK